MKREQQPGETVKKAAVVRRLLEERLEAGLSIKDNAALMEELRKRYPQVKWHTQDVASTKNRFLASRKGDKPTKETAGNPSPETLRAVTKLAEKVGGFVRLAELCQKLAVITGEAP